MRRQICSMILVGSIICGAVQSVYAQGQFVEPQGFTVLFRNTRTPFRWITTQNNQRVAANIHLTGEELEFRLIITGSDGRYYTDLPHPTSTLHLRERDGWIYHLTYGKFCPLHSRDGQPTVVYDWMRIRRDLRPQLEVRWYAVDRSVVDRETSITSTVSPDRNTVINNRDHIRYYLVRISRSPGGGSWGRRSITLQNERTQFSSINGNIIALIVNIRWTDRRGVQREVWIPTDDRDTPLPGLNDCSRRRNNQCIESVTSPQDAVFNQFYAGDRRWYYEPIYSGFLYFDGVTLRSYPMQYPVYVMRDMRTRVDLPTTMAETRRWRVYRATIWENVPYEFGGKFFGCRASGREYNYRNRADNSGTTKGFGLDCSGLIRVSDGVYGDVNYGTWSVWYATSSCTWRELRIGDVIIKPGEHVMLVLSINVELGTVQYIEAIGGNIERTRIHSSTITSLSADGYSPRRFRD